jgi:hypothetical protein
MKPPFTTGAALALSTTSLEDFDKLSPQEQHNDLVKGLSNLQGLTRKGLINSLVGFLVSGFFVYYNFWIAKSRLSPFFGYSQVAMTLFFIVNFFVWIKRHRYNKNAGVVVEFIWRIHQAKINSNKDLS